MSLVAVVLAAGAGSRFGGGKMAASFKGEPLIRHAIRAARAAPVDRVIVVCPPALDIGEWPGVPPVEALRISSSELSASLKAGVAKAAGARGAFIYLGDMPLVPPQIAEQLAGTLGEAYAAMPRFADRPGHPVLLSARAMADVPSLAGDQGAGPLLKARKDIVFVDCTVEGVVIDIDRAEDLTRLEQGPPPGS